MKCEHCGHKFKETKALYFICPSCGYWTCSRCEWTWKPRVEKPRYCTSCKRPLWVSAQVIKRKLEREKNRVQRAREEYEKTMLKIEEPEQMGDVKHFLCFTHFGGGENVPAIVKVGKHHYCAECSPDALKTYLEDLARSKELATVQ